MSNSQEVTEGTKPIHIILLDTSPILLNTPSISTLLANSHVLVTTQSVLNEVRGEEARNRLETLYRPFLDVRSPKPESIKLVKDFAQKTGDSGILSSTDFEILALAYDLECERNGGDWRLRRTPGQRKLNGSPPKSELDATKEGLAQAEQKTEDTLEERMARTSLDDAADLRQIKDLVPSDTLATSTLTSTSVVETQSDAPIISDQLDRSQQMQRTQSDGLEVGIVAEEGSSDSEEGWITPSNIKKHQAQDDAASNSTKTETRTLQVATMTGDFAMQNVLLQMNLNLLSTKTCKRVTHIKQMIFRCHACFATSKDMTKQFCPRCGGPTLTRVTCTTNDKGEVKLHLKANHQWNNRGNVFSVPKPTSGSSNQKWKGPQQGGGKGGWGNDLILAEDQKEYVKATKSARKAKNKDPMDEDILPSILTGDRNQGGGRVRVGAGRNINSRKR